MGWRTRTSALPIRDLRQIAYLLPMWGEIWSGVVFLWRRLMCPQNGSLRMFWYRDLNSSHFFPRFGVLEHEANRTPDMFLLLSSARVKSFVNASECLFVREENESRVFCLSPTGWIVSIGAAEEELGPFKMCAKIWSACGTYHDPANKESGTGKFSSADRSEWRRRRKRKPESYEPTRKVARKFSTNQLIVLDHEFPQRKVRKVGLIDAVHSHVS